MDGITIYDCTPSMSDVVSGNVAHPRERRKRESAGAWLKQTPAWRRFAEFRPDLLPIAPMLASKITTPDYLATPIAFTLARHDTMIAVNEDGTRLAVINLVSEVARLWQREAARKRAGRKPIENPKPATAAQRRWRQKQQR